MSTAFQQPPVHPGEEGSGGRGRRQNTPGNAASVPVIADDEGLRALCRRLRGEKFIAIDTEFMRDHSYWPKLCLIQLAGSKESAVIDPLPRGGRGVAATPPRGAAAPTKGAGLDLSPLHKLLRAPDIVKVFHAARQDIEIFFHDADLIPAPVFDTQIAAMVCGFGEAVSYATLVYELLGASLDKSSRLTDWSQRPLSAKQLSYALDDVVHLRRVYEILARSLEENGRLSWVEEDMARLVAAETYQLQPADAWKRFRRKARSRRAFAILVEVAAWRESLAQRIDVPRTRILKDDALHEVIAAAPTSRAQLEGLRALPKGFGNGKHAQSLLEAIAAGEARAREKSHSLPKKQSFSLPADLLRAHGDLVEMLKLLLKMQCEQHKVASKLVADSGALEAFAVAAEEGEGERALLSGWRGEVFGAMALEAKRGRVGIGVKDGRLVLFTLQGAKHLSLAAETQKTAVRPTRRKRKK